MGQLSMGQLSMGQLSMGQLSMGRLSMGHVSMGHVSTSGGGNHGDHLLVVPDEAAAHGPAKYFTQMAHT